MLDLKLRSFQAALQIAGRPQFAPLWASGRAQKFLESVAEAQTAVCALEKSAAWRFGPNSAACPELLELRQRFESSLLQLGRATARCLDSLSRFAEAERCFVTPAELASASAEALALRGEDILEIAERLLTALDQREAVGSKFFSALLLKRTRDLWDRFQLWVGAPAGGRARRVALTNLPREFQEVERIFANLDDLILQVEDGAVEAGGWSVPLLSAWFAARNVDDFQRRAMVEGRRNTGKPPARG